MQKGLFQGKTRKLTFLSASSVLSPGAIATVSFGDTINPLKTVFFVCYNFVGLTHKPCGLAKLGVLGAHS